MSDTKLKQRWNLLYYCQVLAILDWAGIQASCACGTQPDTAKSVAAVIRRYAYIDTYDYGDGSRLSEKTTVRVTLFGYEAAVVERLWGFMMAGAVPDDVLPFDLDNDYAKALVRKVEAYRAEQAAKHDKCAKAIRDYLKECAASGTKPVKKRVSERTGFGYDYVRTIWDEVVK